MTGRMGGWCVLAVTCSVCADVPRFVSFQGKLAGEDSGPVSLTITLYDAPMGGTQLFTETHANVPLNSGVFSIQIGTATVGGVPDSALNAAQVWLGTRVDAGAELTPRTRLTMVPYAAKSAAAERLVRPGGFGLAASTDASNNLTLFDTSGNTAFRLLPNSLGSAGEFRMFAGDGSTITFDLAGQLDVDEGSRLRMRELDGTVTVQLLAESRPVLNLPGGAYLGLHNTSGQAIFSLDAGNGDFILFQDSGQKAAEIRNFGELSLFVDNLTPTVILTASETGTDGAQLDMKAFNGTTTVLMDADGGDSGAVVNLFDGTRSTVNIDAKEGSTGGAAMYLYNRLGTYTIEIDANETDDASAVRLRKADGTTTITLDPADASGNGRVTTQVLQITGGSDLSEQFEVNRMQRSEMLPAGDARGTASVSDVLPGMVVCIDAHRAGELVVSSRAYDRTVAGVISGAGGVNTGVLMGQDGTAASGAQPIALAGRVYCWCDASAGAIEPGDLLTTSNVPGHAMKVVDPARAQGATIGKAMTRLPGDRGLVLVLVSLQ